MNSEHLDDILTLSGDANAKLVDVVVFDTEETEEISGIDASDDSNE